MNFINSSLSPSQSNKSYAEVARNVMRPGHPMDRPPIPYPTLDPGTVPQRPVPVYNPPLKPKRYTHKWRDVYEELAATGRIFSRTAKAVFKPSYDGDEGRFCLYLRNRYDPQPLLRLARDNYIIAHTKKSVIPRDDIPRGVAQPTAGRQIKRRRDPMAFERGSLYDVQNIKEPIKSAPTRDLFLLCKIRSRILFLKSRRERGPIRLLAYLKYCRYVESLGLNVAEVQGWFTPSIKIAEDTKSYIDDAINKITNSVKTAVDSTTNKIVTNISSVASILITGAAGHSRASWITAIVMSFAVTGIINHDIALKAREPLVSAATKKPVSTSSNAAEAQADSPLQQMEDKMQEDFVATGLTLLFQGIGTYCGVATDITRTEKAVGDWAQVITKNLQFNARSTFGLFSFFKHFIGMCKAMVKKIYCYVHPESEPILAFWEHSEIIRKIINEVNDIVTTPLVNFSDPNVMAKLDSLIALTTEIIVRINSFDQKANGVSLLNYCIRMKTQLLQIKQQCNQQGYSSTTHLTPYCLYLYGNTGVGKSHVLNSLAPVIGPIMEVSPDTNYKVYSRNNGQKYFDGLQKEQIIVYDDFAQFNTTVPDNTDVQEVFALITDQPFRPNMADIPNKGRIIDAKVVLIASNEAFPKRTFLSSNEALWRRRNMLVRAELTAKPPGKNDPFDPEFKHLRFKIHSDVTKTDEVPILSYTYAQLVELIKHDAMAYLTAEKSKLANRLQRAQRLLRSSGRDPLSIESLEGALIALLNSKPETSPFSSYFSENDYIKNIKKWLQNNLPFMYKDPKNNAEIVKVSEEALDEAMAIDGIKETTIDKDNFIEFTGGTLWKTATEEQKKQIRKFWTDTFPDEMFPPDITESSTAEAEAGLELNFSNIDVTHLTTQTLQQIVTDAAIKQKIDPTKVVINYTELLRWLKPYAPQNFMKLPLNLMNPFEFVHFPPYITKFAYRLLTNWIAGDRYFSRSTMLEMVKLTSTINCKHCTVDIFEVEHYVEYGYIVRVDGHTELIRFKNCSTDSTKCIHHHSSLLNIIKVLQPTFYKKIEDFERVYNTYHWKMKKMGYTYDDLPKVGGRLATEKITNCFKACLKKLTKVTSTTVRWLWILLKWLLLLLVPLGIVLAMVMGVKGWAAAKEDSETPCQTVRNLTPHISNQISDIRSTYGKSLFNPYRVPGYEGEAAYTVASRMPGGNRLSPQSYGEGQAEISNDMIKILSKNTMFLYIIGRRKIDDEIQTMNLRAFRIAGNWVLIPKHYITFCNILKLESLEIKVSVPGDRVFEINFASMRVLNISNSELMVLEIPSLPRARDLRCHFIAKQVYESSPIPSHMRVMEKTTDTVILKDLTVRFRNNVDLTCFGDTMITIPECLVYEWSGPGRCMSIILDVNNKIRGFHVAGNKHNGYAQIITKDLLDELGTIENPADLPYIDPFGNPSLNIDTAVEHIGVAQAKFTVHTPTETAIRKSDIHGVFPVRTIPAPLKPCALNDYTDPLELGVRKHGMPTKGFDRDTMEVAELRFYELMTSVVKPIWSDVHPRSIDLAIRGVEGVQSFKPLVLSTSEGFPYLCNRPGNSTSKRWLIHTHDVDGKIEFGLHDQLVAEYEKNMAMRKNGQIPPTVFVDCLKDARLPIEKAKTPGKVRIFSVAPTDFILAFRQYFADFVVAFTHAKFNFCHALGIAPEKDDWTDLVIHLSAVGNKFLCGDYSNFGPGFDHAVHKAVYRSILKWYDQYSTVLDALEHQEHQQIRKIMLIELSEPIHIAGNVFYKTFSGMCSGSPSTTIDNSCVNLFYIMCAWYDIMRVHNPRLATLDAMMKHLRIVVYGDDIIMCISDDAVEFFNNLTLHAYFAKYNIKYTDALKTGELRPYCSLAEASFLKRSFKPHPYKSGVFLGCLDKVSVEDCANWINKTIDTRTASLEASYACLQLAYGHGPEYYNEVREKLRIAWLQKGVLFLPRTWNDYELMYRKPEETRKHLYVAEVQGPPLSTPGENTTCEESVDTVIQDHAAPDIVCPPQISQQVIDWAGADYDASYDRLLDRYVLLDSLEWKSSDVADSYIHSKDKDSSGNPKEARYVLPRDVIIKNINTPTILPFLQHKYANIDMQIKVVANVNKFMVGQLQVSWYYLHEEDAGYRFRDSIYSRSQMIHSVIDAGSSNTAELCIPYKNYRPWIHIGADSELGSNASLGQLAIKVLSQLTMPSTVYKSATLSVYLKFSRGSFMGVIPRSLNNVKAEVEMMSMLTTMAASYLLQKAADSNRDKPPVQLPPQHMQPMATATLATGTGCSEPLHALRLDARGQCPHPDAGDSDMSLLTLAQRPSLLTKVQWSSSKNVGDKLWNIEVTPTPDRTIFQTILLRSQIGSDKAIYGYVVPPISMVAGLMSEWRGSIDFDFVVVGSQYHTGRLLCCFIPYVREDLTLEQAQAVPYVVFDIHDERAFTFTTPYIADKPWWPCGYLNGQKDQPKGIGSLFLLVLNPLIPMDNVANTLDIMVYIKANPSFEVAIPRQSVWGLPWNIETHSVSRIRARDGYAPWFGSTWRYVDNSKVFVLRYGEVSDHVAQFSNLYQGQSGTSGGWYYYTLDPTDPNYDSNKTISISNVSLDDVAFIPIDVNDGYGLIYLGVIAKTELIIGRRNIFPQNYTAKSKPNNDKLMAFSAETAYVIGNPWLKRELLVNTPTLDSFAVSSESAEGEIQICEPSPTVKSTGCGLELFGESYADGKDYLRRYEPLFRIEIPTPRKGVDRSGSYQFAMDVLPSGYDVPLDNPYSQTSRDGGQALVASAYRFYRGSMNLKLISNNFLSTFFLEHRPDRKFESTMYRPAGLTNRDTKWSKNYAQTVLVSNVNKVLTINVPFYQMGSLGLLQRPNPKSNEYALRAYTLGELLIGMDYDTSTAGTTTTLEILKSIGDDMRFYTYTGLPCLIYIGDIIN
ncbi:hypothetical protein [Hubei picorna-like virus 33]|uniref:hypothetical protein n=1 Tax=Hubei picorna-like virus 33 TaxID=1923113 RepID=UPI00090C9D80|nr:hypothetical protein [Hubei picorna-like virus 33]APG77997.1 hypothetical protein [Hubei picorna-like virus 33]